MDSIRGWGQKIKLLFEEGIGEWGLLCLLFLVGFASFGLGRLSASEAVKSPVSVTQATAIAKVRPMNMGGQYVASKTGTVYYFPWCTAAQKIAPENQVWFGTEGLAQAAGYRPGKNCKGLVSQ